MMRDQSDVVQAPLSIVPNEVADYIDGLLTDYDEPVLLEMEALARERNFPIVGRQIGSCLGLLTQAVGAKRVFEFGSGFGYSAYWFCKAISSDGKVICTDGDQANVNRAENFLRRAKLASQIEFHCGQAQGVFKKQSGAV